MKTVTVSASGTYDVIIGEDLISNIGSYVKRIQKPCKCAIISDSNVWPIYGETVSDSLESAGFEMLNYVFPAGESSKNGETYLAILNFLAENQVTRSDLLVALGGGVVGDITGFAAATYLRGISYIQVPTSLLAMVDSSVGGKTAIDLPAGKNLAGAFYQPSLVLCDVNALNTLTDSIFQDGCAEVIKYGVLYDPSLFAHLKEKGLSFDREKVIARCVDLKRNVVMEDERDTRARQKLNLGHTIGHAIEANSAFTVSHGQAVAIGMSLVTKACCNLNMCDDDLFDEISGVIRQFHLPTETTFGVDELYNSALSDKKRSGGTVNLIVPRSIGLCEIYPIEVEKLRTFIEAGL